MAEVVNLDALIPREDFLASDGPDAGSSGKSEATRTDLTKGESFFLTLRKPDFQRETAAWSPEAVRDFIKAFIEGDLIPSVICWQSPSRLSFVIDGAHRLSAIIAWLNNDYGDGEDSIKFYSNNIPEEQRKIAAKTRALVDASIGPWKDYQAETKNPGSNPKLTDRARALAHASIPLLWIKGSESTKAERAFITINRSAVEIDPTELKILNARFQPNAIAARAVVRNATGTKYWASFSEGGQEEVERLAKEIYKHLYSPPLQTPIRSVDLPVAGPGYGSQTLPLIFDFVNIASNLPVIDASKKKQEFTPQSPSSPDETDTLKVLRNADKLSRRMTGTHASSLGLHPAVYFYSATGRHQPTAVLAMAALVMDLDKANQFGRFTDVRAKFEQFLIDHKSYVNQLTTRYGSMAKGYRQLKEYFAFVLAKFMDGKTPEEVGDALTGHERYHTLVKEKPIESKQAKEFSQSAKQWAFLRDTMSKSMECAICGARIDHKAMTLDHAVDKEIGGPAAGSNAQWAHPYCNSTYKRLVASNDTKIAAA